MVLAAAGSLVLAFNAAAADSNLEILKAWLTAFDAGDADHLRQFQERYLGNSDIAFALDCREETVGFDLVKVESDEPEALVALVRERAFPSLWRVSLTRASAAAATLKRLDYRPVPASQPEALAGLNDFATRLAAADRFSGVVAVAQHRMVSGTWESSSRRTVGTASGFTALPTSSG